MRHFHFRWALLIAGLTIFICTESIYTAYGQESHVVSKIILVRHAEKAEDGTKDPHLSAEGINRARKLASIFEEIQIDGFYATPFKRTRETLSFLAAAQQKEITDYIAKDPDSFAQVVQAGKGKNIMIAGHSNTIPQLVNLLLGYEKYAELDETEYGKIWIVVFKDSAVIDCSVIRY